MDTTRTWKGQHGTLVQADNLTCMRSLPSGACDLIYADPPFMSQQRRRSAKIPSGYDDRWPNAMAGYLSFLEPRLREMHRLLPEHGSLYVHVDWRTAHRVRVTLDDIFGYENFLNEIIWSYRTGGRTSRWFARKHDTLLLYAKSAGRHTFHLQRGGKFRTEGLKHDEDGRPYKSTRNGRLYFHVDGPALTDVWEIPFLSTVSLERTGYPSQKPLALLERIVSASSNPGDTVADFFCGSGTTLDAAQRLERHWLGCDSEAEAVRIAAERLNLTYDPHSEPNE